MKTIMVLLLGVLIALNAAFAQASRACGTSSGLPRHIDTVECDRVKHAGSTTLRCGVTFANFDTEYKRMFNVGVYLKNKSGQKMKAAGNWKNTDWYMARFDNANLSSNLEQFKVQFIVEEKSGEEYYKSSWMGCN